MKILVTGGAGFIGSHLTDQLINEGHEVTVFDKIDPQVHKKIPIHLNPKAKYIIGDVRNKEEFHKAIGDNEGIFHYAAAVGVGQSMYDIANYTDVNIGGTANLLDLLVNKENSVKKLVVASSMSIYGEGSYKCPSCGATEHKERTDEQLKQKEWEPKCKECDTTMEAIPTSEKKPTIPTSVYAITKKVQEDMVLNVGRSYSIPSVALRFFNVFGTRQSLSNPYTGVAAIFMSRIKNNNHPLVFEDGNQTRDFVSVHDIVQASIKALNSSSANYDYFNVGGGNRTSILDVAKTLIDLQNASLEPNVTHNFRVGDIRHCFADISKIQSKLDYEPKVTLRDGLSQIIKWSENTESEDMVERATKELQSKNLIS